MDTILEILETIKPGANFAASTDFIEEHLLESMEILQLVSELKLATGFLENTTEKC